MRLSSTKPSKKSLVTTISLLVVLALAVGALVWLIWQNQNTSNADSSVNYDPPTQEEKNDPTQKQTDPSGAHKDPGATPPETPDLSVTITRAGQTAAGQPLNIRTVVTGASSGTCSITLEKDGQPKVTKTADIVFSVSSASCNTNIPMEDFSVEGEWRLTITALKNGSESTPISQEVTIVK